MTKLFLIDMSFERLEARKWAASGAAMTSNIHPLLSHAAGRVPGSVVRTNAGRNQGSFARKGENTRKYVLYLASMLDREPVRVMAWYLEDSIADLSGLTADQLVREGRAAEVIEYLLSIMSGERG